jgi:hypothetical protein
MKGPLCKICDPPREHWSYEPHVFPETKSAKQAPPETKITVPETIIEPETKSRGRPKKYASNAERLAAFRKRRANGGTEG